MINSFTCKNPLSNFPQGGKVKNSENALLPPWGKVGKRVLTLWQFNLNPERYENQSLFFIFNYCCASHLYIS
jgi:hypothetical protein